MNNRKPGNPDVWVNWVIGDAATIDSEDTQLPAASQVAKTNYLIKKLNKIAKDRAFSAPLVFHNQDSLAYIGNWKTIFDKTGQVRRTVS